MTVWVMVVVITLVRNLGLRAAGAAIEVPKNAKKATEMAE